MNIRAVKSIVSQTQSNNSLLGTRDRETTDSPTRHIEIKRSYLPSLTSVLTNDTRPVNRNLLNTASKFIRSGDCSLGDRHRRTLRGDRSKYKPPPSTHPHRSKSAVKSCTFRSSHSRGLTRLQLISTYSSTSLVITSGNFQSLIGIATRRTNTHQYLHHSKYRKSRCVA